MFEKFKQREDFVSAWRKTHEEFVSQRRAEGARDLEQSWKSASGKAFEAIAKEIIKEIKERKELEEDIRRGILAEKVWIKGDFKKPEIAESMVDLIALQIREDRPIRVVQYTVANPPPPSGISKICFGRRS